MNTLTQNELVEINGGDDGVPVASWPAQPYVPPSPSFGWGNSAGTGGRNGLPRHVSD